MTAYIVRRLIQAVLVIIIVSLLVFFVLRYLPGDPILTYLAQSEVQLLTQENIDAARHEHGLDKPIVIQYINWINALFHGDLGTSLFIGEEVSTLLAQRLPITMYLGVIAFIISSIVGILSGVLPALRRGTWTDTAMTLLANVGICIPVFWLGILLIYLFGLRLHWLPTMGFTWLFDDFWPSIKQTIMPVMCLSIFGLAATARQARSSMLEVIQQDYIRTAWSKGLKERTIVMRHMLKNGIIPVVTFMGIGFSYIVSGSVLVETVFGVPGMGRLAVTAVLGQDYAIVQVIVLITAVIVVFINLIVDITYGWLDPRIRYR